MEGAMVDALIIRKTLRVPAVAGPDGDGAPVARQPDQGPHHDLRLPY